MHRQSITRTAGRIVAALAFIFAFCLALPAPAQDASTSRDDAPVVGLHRVDVNQASLEELVALPGIGPALAQRIIDAREEQPFRRPQDLVRVQGIGHKTMMRLLPYVTTGERQRGG